jgi:hypothetical protein
MTEIVVRDRIVARILTVLPAVVVVLAVRVMTLGSRPEPLRLAAAGVVALACWTAYRLLTVRVTIGAEQVHVRGVFYDAQIGYDDLRTVTHNDPSLAVRALVWGTVQSRGVTIVAREQSIRPLALLSAADDVDIDRAVDALLVRTGAYRIPSQRHSGQTKSAESTVTTR